VSARPPGGLLARVERLLGTKPVGWHAARGGYSIAERWSLDLEDGRRVFVKMAPNDDQARRIRDEYRNMSLFDADFRCEIVGWDDDGQHPLLVLEDLRDARWPPPWEPGDVERVRATLERIWAMPSDGLPAGTRLPTMFSGWDDVVVDPGPFSTLGIASVDWATACAPTLADAARSVDYAGEDFLHMDVRSDTMCFAGDRVVFVDWNWAVRGPREVDFACWLPSLRLEGGPLPDEIAPGHGAHAAALCAYFARNAPLPPPEGAPTVRRFQLRQLRIALPWACRELGLPQPDGDWAGRELTAADADLEAGRIDETRWHAAVEEALIDAYLSVDDVRGQSGKSGDEVTWRWARELILDVFPPRATFLDVGCANGYLMESIHRWGRERRIDVEPYGLDISWRIAALARHRLPHWRDRIFVGNAIDWDPPMRFDVVQIGIDEAPAPRRRTLIERVLHACVTPGGKLVFRSGRAGQTTYPTPDEQLRELGFRPDGVIEARHPETGEVRRTAWLDAPLR
jgi:hypothetical protein